MPTPPDRPCPRCRVTPGMSYQYPRGTQQTRGALVACPLCGGTGKRPARRTKNRDAQEPQGGGSK
jgi:hypothetical protein